MPHITGFSSLQSEDKEALEKLINKEILTLQKVPDADTDKIDRKQKEICAQEDSEQELSKQKRLKLSATDEGPELEIAFSTSDVRDTYKNATLLPKWRAFQTIIYLEQMHPSIPEKLQSLYNDGYKLVIFTNESNIERWKKNKQAAVDSKIGRLEQFIKVAGVPIQNFAYCHFRSFYVGDAAGRQGDHSDADIKFAQAIGLRFYVPEEFFGKET
ncbi:hypothetical protein K7X08_012240 [Anisodus acutangulus]|uniref:Uncharacterized protein n=1 Tax=Anisodus acutangulus TaxID=402998 RepID=A0A9Q1LB05_9SOLA|nr:hypothetical protein K7X08_012240 [Anisodus acutangulus]